MDWYVQADYVGVLTDGEVMLVAEGTMTTVAKGDERTLRVTITAEGTYEDAHRALMNHTVLRDLVAGGVLTGPFRVLAETEDMRAESRDMLGTRDVAGRLGVTPARVRQLRKRPDWPAPLFTLPGGEEIHSAAAIDSFNAGWDRKPGRPSKDP